MSTPAATYAPEMQLLTLKPEFEAFADPANPRGFETPEQVAIFFHEWIHYLHNVSTVHGLTTFGTLTIVWSNFRRTIGDDGWSHGKAIVPENDAQDIERQYELLKTLRGRRRTTLPPKVAPHLVTLDQVRAAPAVDRSPDELTVLECNAVVAPATEDGLPRAHKVYITANEILECAAYMLEEKAAVAMKTLLPPPSVNPYLLVPKARDRLAPGLSDECLLMCALSSVQCADPPQALLSLLQVGVDAQNRGDDPCEAVRAAGEGLLDSYESAVQDTIAQIKEMFPVDEPMARAVLSTVNRIQRNLSFRKEDLFFELSIVEALRQGPAIMRDAINRYGAPSILQKRKGDQEQMGLDLIYAFDLQGEPEGEVAAGWNMMHAAFKFLNAHLRTGSLVSTNLAVGATCPFYTSCPANYRRVAAQNCKSAPWLSIGAEEGLCEYASAVVATRPIEVSKKLADGGKG